MKGSDLVWRKAGDFGCYLLFSPALLFVEPVRRYWMELLAASLVGYLVVKTSDYRARQIGERFGLQVVPKGRDGALFSSKYQVSIEWERLGGKHTKVIYLSQMEAAIPRSEREEFRLQIVRYFEALGERVEIA